MSRRKKHYSIDELNITPLIDVIFLLLIYFFVATTFKSYSILDIDTPEFESSENRLIDKDNMVLNIDLNKNIIINVNGKQIRLKKVKDIKEYVNQNNSIVLNADSNLNYGYIISLLDELKILGYSDVLLNTEGNKK